MDENKGTEDAPSEAPVTPSPDEAGHEDVSGGDTTPQSGAPQAAEEEADE